EGNGEGAVGEDHGGDVDAEDTVGLEGGDEGRDLRGEEDERDGHEPDGNGQHDGGDGALLVGALEGGGEEDGAPAQRGCELPEVAQRRALHGRGAEGDREREEGEGEPEEAVGSRLCPGGKRE